jgi:hypothetical protein
MEKRSRTIWTWFSEHSYEALEVIGNIAAVAVFIAIAYLILRYLIKYG